VADLGGVTRQGKKGLSRFVSVNAAPAPTSAVPPRPQGDLTRASIEEIAQAVRTTWPTKPADNRWRRSRGARDLLEHLSEFPGQTWQDRWLASGFNEPGRPVSVLRSAPQDRSQIGTGAACLFCLRVIQPSLEAFRSNQFLYYGKRFLVAQNDPLLDKFWEQVQSTSVNPVHHGTALFDVAVALTTQGIALADLTPAAVLYYATRRTPPRLPHCLFHPARFSEIVRDRSRQQRTPDPHRSSPARAFESTNHARLLRHVQRGRRPPLPRIPGTAPRRPP
jgi:hypothetical protein